MLYLKRCTDTRRKKSTINKSKDTNVFSRRNPPPRPQGSAGDNIQESSYSTSTVVADVVVVLLLALKALLPFDSPFVSCSCAGSTKAGGFSRRDRRRDERKSGGCGKDGVGIHRT